MAKKAVGGKTSDLIKQVIDEIDAQISELTTQRTQLAKMVSGNAAAAGAGVRRRGRPPAAVAAAATPATSATSATSATPAKKRKVSNATKAKLKAAAKARWARYRTEQKAAGG